MRASRYLLFLMLFLIPFAACKEEKEVIDDEWKQKNEKAFSELIYNSEYDKITAESGNGYIFYKPLKKGKGKKIFYTSRVQVYYKGSYIDGKEFDSRQFEDGTPFKCAVSPLAADYNAYTNPNGYQSVIEGWTVALQHMVEGDKWLVWIPQELAYGKYANGDIPAYSTLVFEIEVVSVDRQ